MEMLRKKALFNPEGDTDVRLRRMLNGNTTNLNDFNNMKYTWVSEWYRQAMNNFWIPEEINLSQDLKDYPKLLPAERRAYDKILSFLVFLDSIQTANLPNISAYVTANEVNLCLISRPFRSVCIRRVIAICWIVSAHLWNGMRSCISGKRIRICCGAIPSLETAIIHSRRINRQQRCCAC